MENNMETIDFGTEIVLETPGVVRVPHHPANDRIQDSLLVKQKWTRDDCDLLISCLENYAN